MKTLPQIDWAAIEARLFELTCAESVRFSCGHTDEEFYSFAFDCNADYGQLLLCLSTKEHLRQEAESCQAKYADSCLNKPLADWEAELRWALGDWKYQGDCLGFGSDEFNAGWSECENLIVDSCWIDPCDDRKVQLNFLNSACRVALRLEHDDAFSSLKRTPDFAVYVADHDELEEISWARLNAIRREKS